MSDVHLGCTRYNLAESPKDFFDAWISVIHKYVLNNDVDFVIICGDFFHKKSVPPETMNYAIDGLALIREAGIPVVAIEGNHDQKPTDMEFSWLRSLSRWGYIKLLEPSVRDKIAVYDPWDEDAKKGGYIDIGRARIFGSEWYGASGNWAIPALVDSIKIHQREDAFHILMLHTDVEGYQTHPIPAINVRTLSELKEVAQYVGLGHTHMHYEIDNWAFNPGSIEITDISQFRETRGIFVVDVDDDNTVHAYHQTDYVYRDFQRLVFDVSRSVGSEDVVESVLELVEREARVAEEGKPSPIIEIALIGIIGFPSHLIDMRRMSVDAKKLTSALEVRIKNKTTATSDVVTSYKAESHDRTLLERKVIGSLVSKDIRFRKRPDLFTDMILAAKNMVLDQEDPEDIAGMISIRMLEAENDSEKE